MTYQRNDREERGDRRGADLPTWSVYAWQILTTVMSAAMVAIWAWAWNTTMELRDMRSIAASVGTAIDKMERVDRDVTILAGRVDRVEREHDAVANDLGTLKADLRQSLEQNHDQVVQFARLWEIVRQVREDVRAIRGMSNPTSDEDDPDPDGPRPSYESGRRTRP